MRTAAAPQPYFRLVTEDFLRDPDGDLCHVYRMKNLSGYAAALKVRVVYWNEGYLSPAAARKAIAVTFSKKGPRRP